MKIGKSKNTVIMGIYFKGVTDIKYPVFGALYSKGRDPGNVQSIFKINCVCMAINRLSWPGENREFIIMMLSWD